MALIRNANSKNISGGYSRIFGNSDLGKLISKIQSSVISSGNELERIIARSVPNVQDLDELIQLKKIPKGIFIAGKKQMKSSAILSSSSAEPDFLIFKRYSSEQTCHVVELKDGHVFDTKKAEAETQNMRNFISRNAQKLNFTISAHFCAFNQESKEIIQEGFKNRISIKEAMSGQELCDLLEINYKEIVNMRQRDQEKNIDYFVSELVKIDVVRSGLKELLKK